MTVETLREAWRLNWKVRVLCRGKTPLTKKRTKDCGYSAELDLHTLAWTKGPNFPLSHLAHRLMCPRCDGKHVVVLFEPPGVEPSLAKRVSSRSY